MNSDTNSLVWTDDPLNDVATPLAVNIPPPVINYDTSNSVSPWLIGGGIVLALFLLSV